jgi:hypothetical protein
VEARERPRRGQCGTSRRRMRNVWESG